MEITARTLLLALAALCFLAAVGWSPHPRLNLIAAGLFLLTLAFLFS